MNILIPMGGIGHRFSKENYRFPKPLINIVGRPMLFWLLDHLDTQDDDMIYIGILESIEKQFDLSHRLKMEYPQRNIETIRLDFETRGAVETLFIMLQSINEDRLELKSISLDCDTIYFQSILNQFRSLANRFNASYYFKDNLGKPIYSYLKLDENHLEEQYYSITDVKEKVMISNNANTGAYAFRSGSILKEYCIQLLDQAVGCSGEYYTTNLMKLMLDKNEIFLGIEVNWNSFVCVGTPDQLNEFLKNLKKKENLIQIRQMRFCFDLDNTLVTYPTRYADYHSVQPKLENIQLVRELHRAGHYIIIQTARRMKTHQGNIGAVIADIGQITIETLTRFQIPYDELLFGKPYADIYIDDSSIHALIDTTKEIGWSLDQTSQEMKIWNDQSKKGFISSRHYHTIEQLDHLIIKSSSNNDLRGEIYFYQNIPENIFDLFPKLHHLEINKESNISSLLIDHIHGTTYSHLLTNLCLTNGRLIKLLSSLKRIHCSLSKESLQLDLNIYANYSMKISSRYEQFQEIYDQLDQSSSSSSLITSNSLFQYLINYFHQYEREQKACHYPIIHGDPVFSNILLTEHSDVIFLDMRGCLGEQMTFQGDLYYDLGKVYQSLTGYDFILLNKIHLLTNSSVNKYLQELEQIFEQFLCNEYDNRIDLNQLKMITAQFYFTLIPLHTNFEHQKQFYQLAVQLYQQAIANEFNEI